MLVKTAALQFDPYTITFARFAIGAGALAVLLIVARRSPKPEVFHRWIWIGALGKFGNYLFENIGITVGYAYGNVLILPSQTIVLLLAGWLLFKERLSAKSWIAAVVVLAGVLLMTLNGRSLYGAIAAEGWVTLLFVLSGIGAALHFLSTKMLLETMTDVSMNYSVFFWASAFAALPLPLAVGWEPGFVPGAWLSAAALGLITGVSFIFLSKALRTVKFSVAVVITNMAALFTVLWSGLLLDEPVTEYIVAGAAAIVAGMIMLNWPSRALERGERA